MSVQISKDCRLIADTAQWLKIIRLGTLTVLWTISTPVLAQQEEVIGAGREIFLRKCAVCHGSEGKGDGRLGPHLKTPPADLAQLTRRYDGAFPFWTIYTKIDGRTEVTAHGSREMPVWGTDQPTEDTTGHLAMGQLLALVFFLESIQEE